MSVCFEGRWIPMAASVALALLPALLGLTPEASAHGLVVRCAVLADGQLETRVLYDDGTPAAGATVRIFADHDVASEGSADDSGLSVLSTRVDTPLWVEARHGVHRRLVRIAVDADGNLEVQESGATDVGLLDSKLLRVVAGCAAILLAAALLSKFLSSRRRRRAASEGKEGRGAR